MTSSRQRTTSNQTQTQNQVTDATQTPVAPDWVTGPAMEYVGRIGAFGDMDPNQFVAPSSPLQNMAWDNAASTLGGNRGQFEMGSRLAGMAGALPVNQIESPHPVTAHVADAPQLGDPNRVGSVGYTAPRLGNASFVSGQGYTAPNLGPAQGYGAARVGSPIGATARSAGPAAQASAATVNSGGSVMDNLPYYQNPWNDQLVQTSLGDYDQNAARVRAQQEAQAAASGAFGGSRNAITQSLTEGELARGRGALDANLRAQGFREASTLALADMDRAQQRDMFNAQNLTGVNLANAGAANQFALSDANAANQVGMFNAGAANDTARYQAGLDTQAAQFGAQSQNQFGLANAGFQADAARYGADAANQAGMANANAANQFALAQGGFDQAAGQFGADATNRAILANQGAENQFALSRAGFDQANNQFNASTLNQMGQFNAGQALDAARFNAGQGDVFANRQLQAAQLLGGLAGQYGDSNRADLAMMAQLGEQQRAIEAAYRGAPLSQLQSIGALSGLTPYQILVGQRTAGTTSGTGTTNGTQTTVSSPSPISSMLGLASLFG